MELNCLLYSESPYMPAFIPEHICSPFEPRKPAKLHCCASSPRFIRLELHLLSAEDGDAGALAFRLSGSWSFCCGNSRRFRSAWSKSFVSGRSWGLFLCGLCIGAALPYPPGFDTMCSLLWGERFDEVGGAADDDVVVCYEERVVFCRVQNEESLLLSTNKILFSVSQSHAVTAIPVSAVIFFLSHKVFWKVSSGSHDFKLELP